MAKLSRPYIIYLCNAIDERCRHLRLIDSDSPAATNKVMALARAMRLAGLKCVVLSLGRGRQNGKGAWYKNSFCRVDGVLIVYCSFLHFPVLTHLLSAVSMAMLVMWFKLRKSNLALLSYNRSVHYIFALLCARFTSIRSFLDLEDGYIQNNSSLFQSFKNNFVRFLYRYLCSSGAMIANIELARQLDEPPKIVCYGVAQKLNANPNWGSTRLQILFSGTLLEEVGSSLLISAINILRQRHPIVVNKLHFVVTGKGPFAENFANLEKNAPEWISYRGFMSREAYYDTLNESHVGLSLRLSQHEMSSTTFPSKIIEYAEHGLLIITTKVRDISMIFDDSVLYLHDETAEALAEIFADLPNERSSLCRIALRGQEKVAKVCNPISVGTNICEMLMN